jgi:hypothetical protein
MNSCSSIRAQFSEYLDGVIAGAGMRSIAAHLQSCQECSAEFAAWRNLQSLLTAVGPAKPPSDLGLRLRVAISQEQSRTVRRRMDCWQMHWQNSLAPILARGAAGLASAVILLTAAALMIGTVAAPPTVAANEALPDSSSTPQFLYTVGGTDSRVSFRAPVLVQADISPAGRVYDYTIVSGPESKAVRAELDNILLMSHFTPALSYGVPVRGRAILSFSGTSVRG